MPLTVLTDRDVRECLDTLTKDDVLQCQSALADALHSYSTASDPADSKCCSTNQPKRIIIKRPDGSSTLFMPSMSDNALGVKVLTVAESARNNEGADLQSLKLSEPESPRTSTHSSFSSPSRASTSSSSTSITRDSSRHGSTTSSVTTTSTSSATQPKIAEDIRDPNVGMLEPSATSPKGSITLLLPNGEPRAIINASTLTAFRTALASTALLKLRQRVHTLTVFGAGLQAYWHIFLTLILQDGLHHIHVINRDFERAQRLMMTLASSGNRTVSDAFLSTKLRPGILTPMHTEYSRLLKEYVRAADVIYCCTPSTQPLFPASFLTNTDGRKKARYIAAIGSYKPHMQELPEELLRQAVRGPEEAQAHHHGIHLRHRHAHEGGAIIVDTIEGAMKESGEVIKSGIGGQGIVEIGELIMLKRSHWQEKAEQEEHERKKREKEEKKASSHGGHGLGHLFHHDKEKTEPQEDRDGGLKNWLERGNVIYKSVGL